MSFSEFAFLVAAICGASALAILVILVRRRRRRRRRGIPLVDWEVRAQVAERRAEQAEATLRAGLVPYLARLLRSKLVTGLLFQRRHLVKSHREGAERAEALEQRLATAHAGLQEKLRDYEDKLQSLGDGGPLGSSAPSAPVTSVQPEPARRRNPLVQRPAGPPPAPVKFAELVSRKQKDKEEAPKDVPEGGPVSRD